MLLLAIPLTIIFEIGIIASRIFYKKKEILKE
jgi:Sec-independent protein secretion pathway component TatC